MALDRKTFIRPIAHRGLHDAARGVIENTEPAFTAAIAGGFGIECDLRPAADGTPMVFHDATLDRLVEGKGPVASLSPAALGKLAYKVDGGSPAGAKRVRILSFASFLDLVAGRVPLLVEVKSEWAPPDPAFLGAIATQAAAYKGPIAFMSFDPAVMAALAGLAPKVPRGIVAGSYRPVRGDDWWSDKLDAARRFRLRHLLESGPARVSFFAYHVKSLPTHTLRFAQAVMGLPVFTWTVRTAEDRARAAKWADAMIFEGFVPESDG